MEKLILDKITERSARLAQHPDAANCNYEDHKLIDYGIYKGLSYKTVLQGDLEYCNRVLINNPHQMHEFNSYLKKKTARLS